MSEVIEEIRTALAMQDAGYAVLFDHKTSAELLRQYDHMRKALEARDKKYVEQIEWWEEQCRLQASRIEALEEPVAWRWRMKGSAYWDYAREEPQGPSIHLFEVQPLYAVTDSK